MTETKAERSPQAEAIANYYQGRVSVLSGSVDWHIRNIEAHIAHGVTASALRAIIAEATGALELASKAEALEEVLKHL
jgi:hypothetical protein